MDYFLKKTLLILLFFLVPLYATIALKNEYFFTNETITANILDANLSSTIIVLKIDKNKTHYRVNAKAFQKKLKKLNIKATLPRKHPYISFIKISPINTAPLVKKLKHYYMQYYENMKIDKIEVWPHTYLAKMPETYSIEMPRNSAKRSSGTLELLLPNRQKILFDYQISAYLMLPVATKLIAREGTLSKFNTKTTPVVFQNMRDKPLNNSQIKFYCAKHTIRIGDIITQKDVALTPLIKRYDDVNVQMRHGALVIEFSAQALSNGGLNDMITLEKSDGKRVRAKVIGKSRAQMP